MRATSLILCAFAVALSTACTRDATSDAPNERCATMHRLASNDVQVMSLDPLAGAARPAIACKGLSCLRTEPDVALIVQPDGGLWAAWGKEPGRLVSDPAGVVVGEVPAHVTAFVEDARMRGVVSASRDRGDDASAAAIAAEITAEGQPVKEPALPLGMRTCGTTSAGGGLGYHVIQNDGDTWQRVQWTRPPTNADVLALPANAYPLAIGAAGTLCGYATQKAPREWQVHSPSGAVVVTAPNREHPPAHCISIDVISVDAGDHAVHIARDGTLTKKELPAPSGAAHVTRTVDPVLPLFGASSSNHPNGTLRVADSTFARVLTDAVDLAGNALPKGAQRRRVASVGDGVRFVLITEKIDLADCTTRELVHLLDTSVANGANGAVTTVRDADVVVAKLSAAAGRFWWLEATPQIVDVAN